MLDPVEYAHNRFYDILGPMTTRELIVAAGEHPQALSAFFAAVPAASYLLGRAHPPGEGGLEPWRRGYAWLVYLACVPGTFAAVITAYSVLFDGRSLLDLDVSTHFVPIASMAASLFLMRRTVDFDLVPGFDRIGGLLTMLGCAFATALVLQRTFIGFIFIGSWTALAGLAAAVFLLFRWGAKTFFRAPGAPAPKNPLAPGP